MKLFLDTHTFLWWIGNPKKLSQRVHDLCQLDESELYLSVVSVWEIELKVHAGKLKLDTPIKLSVEQEMQRNELQVIPVIPEHIYAVSALPAVHKDPFDRLIIAQAIYINASLVSVDSAVSAYPVPVIW